jgi:hypothetical protein
MSPAIAAGTVALYRDSVGWRRWGRNLGVWADDNAGFG